MFQIGDRVRYEWEGGVATGRIVDMVVNRADTYIVAWTDVHVSEIEGRDLEAEWR